MLKPTASFRLNKTTKRMMAAHADSGYSNTIKRNFIQSQLYGAQQYKPAKSNKESQGN